MQTPQLIGLYLFVKDIDASLAFYRALGLKAEKLGDSFARVFSHGEVMMELGTSDLTGSYDPKHSQPTSISKGTINFELDSVSAVDALFESLVNAGNKGHLTPFNAPWQARFAVVLDPDGNQVGLHSPRSNNANDNTETNQ